MYLIFGHLSRRDKNKSRPAGFNELQDDLLHAKDFLITTSAPTRAAVIISPASPTIIVVIVTTII